MATRDRYTTATDTERWDVPTQFDCTFSWEYEDGSETLHDLYAKSKHKQWDGASRIDWSRDLDPENPAQLPDSSIPIFASDVFRRLTPTELASVRRHFQSWQLSQFLHGEQGALLCAAKIVQQVPTLDAKSNAATQVIDEARHVEVYSRLLHDKFGLVYPITPALKRLLENVLSDRRWDMTYLGMQVLIEGLALAAVAQIRDQSESQLVAAVHAYVMQDEARHVAFGRHALRDFYPALSEAERDEREEFAVEACYLLRDQVQPEAVWATLGLPVAACRAFVLESGLMRSYRASLFSRIVPTMKEIGLWGPRIRKAYSDMGVIGFAELDPAALSAADDRVAHQFDLRRFEAESSLAERAGRPR
jgi:hypothetical protein